MPRCLYSDSKYNSTSSVLYPLKYDAWCVLNGGVNYKTKANHRLCKWCNLKRLCYLCTTQNTFSHTISFYPYQSPMKWVLWSPFDTGEAKALFPGIKSHWPLAVFWWEAMLFVLVGGRCWEGSREGKNKGWGMGWRENPTGGGWGWLRGQSPRSKVTANFQ